MSRVARCGVADKGEDLGAASGQADGRRDRSLTLVALALVVGAGIGVATNRSQSQHVHYAARAEAVALRCVQPSGGFARVSREQSRPGPGGELVGRADQRGIAYSSEEFDAEPKSHTGQAGDQPGEWMTAKSVLVTGNIGVTHRIASRRIFASW